MTWRRVPCEASDEKVVEGVNNGKIKAGQAKISKNVPIAEKLRKNDQKTKSRQVQAGKAIITKLQDSKSTLNKQDGDGEVRKTVFDYAMYWNSRFGRAGMDALDAVGAVPTLTPLTPLPGDLAYHDMMMDHQRMVDRIDKLCKKTDDNIVTMQVFLMTIRVEHL